MTKFKFFLFTGSENTSICGISNKVRLCIKEATREYYGQVQCDCLPSCTSLNYDFEVTLGDIKHRYFFVGGTILNSLNVYFKEAQFVAIKRYERYGSIDFLANCGGLLGLFMGFSVLSFIELLYFCTLRLINNIRTDRSNVLED